MESVHIGPKSSPPLQSGDRRTSDDMISSIIAGFTCKALPISSIHQVSLMVCRKSIVGKLGEVHSFWEGFF